MLDRRITGVWQPSRQLSPDRADAGRHLELLRREPGPGVAAQHRDGRTSALAGQWPPEVRRLAWSLGREYARHRRDEFHPEDGLSGLARALAFGRALDAHSAGLARGRCH